LLAGDDLEVHRYERLAPLTVAKRAVPGLSPRRGDCLVAFSRKEVHFVKRQVESRGRLSQLNAVESYI
jgi:ATP-dependent RNA helicase SUPV3L1/SUV3